MAKIILEINFTVKFGISVLIAIMPGCFRTPDLIILLDINLVQGIIVYDSFMDCRLLQILEMTPYDYQAESSEAGAPFLPEAEGC